MANIQNEIPSPAIPLMAITGYMNPVWWDFFYNFLARMLDTANFPDVIAIENLLGTGFPARIADNTWALRSIDSGNPRITVANGGGIAGNPTITFPVSGVAAATYGSASAIPSFTVDTYGTLTFALNNSLVSTGMTYTYPSSSTTRSVFFRLTDRVSVKDFGAQGDGVTDDTTAIQAALTVAAGRELYFPNGQYKISTELSITSGMILKGESINAGIYASNQTQNVIKINTTSSVVIRDLTISTSVTKTAGAGIVVTATTENSRSVFENLTIGSQYVGIDIQKGVAWLIKKCYFASFVTAGLQIANSYGPDSGDNCLESSTFDTAAATSYCIKHLSSGGLRIINNKFLNATYGYGAQMAAGVNTSDLIIASNSFEIGTTALIFTDPSGATGYSNIHITDNQLLSGTGSVIDLQVAIYNRLVISGNIIQIPATKTGIILANSSDAVLTNNNFYAPGATSTGINIAASFNRATIGNNNFFNTATNISDSSSTTYYDVAHLGQAAQGDVVYSDATNSFARLAKNTSSTRYLSNTGSSNNPAWAQVNLTNGITGILPIANGGTGVTANCSFQAVRSSTQSINASSTTRVQFNTENFDTAGTFDTANYRHLPTVAGKYFYKASIQFAAFTNASVNQSIIFGKNGSRAKAADFRNNAALAQGDTIEISCIIDMDGSSDFVEVYVSHNDVGAVNIIGDADYNTFLGYRISA